MFRRNALPLIIVIIIFALAVCVVLPIEEGILGKKGVRLGLDLVGGVHLVYRAEFSEEATEEDKARSVDRALEVIRTRIDKYGVVEPVIQSLKVAGKDAISVKLPGFTDIEEAKKLVEQTGFLEFKEVELNDEGNPVYLDDYLEMSVPEFFNKDETDERIFVGEGSDGKYYPIAFLVREEDGNLVYKDEEGNPIDVEELREIKEQIVGELPSSSILFQVGSPALLSWITARGDDGTPLIGKLLVEATPNIITKPTGIEAEVGIRWNNEGRVVFDQVAGRIYNSGEYGTPNRALGIFLDDVLLSYPQILQQKYEGTAAITGTFTIDEVYRLANLLESGALPMPLEKSPLFQEKVSATQGLISVDMSLFAGLIGIILVMLFMIIYYRLPGVLASLALIFYGTLVLAIFKLIPVTLTLAGIGGFVLSIGMAVDANVLIFERMKEELRAGRTLGAAIDTGFNRAWTAIRDSNVTTFIVCGILYWLGSSIIASAPVMGFALTLFIGVAVSMFTAIVVTRTLLRLFVGTPLARWTSLFSVYSGRK